MSSPDAPTPEGPTPEGTRAGSANVDPLSTVRAHIDEIDDRIIDLLVERARLSLDVGRAKRASGASQPTFRPGREALILHRLLDRGRGAAAARALDSAVVDPGAVIRIWREIFAASTRLQGAFAAAVFAPDALPGYWDLARDQFGSHTPMPAFRSIGQVVRAVTDGQCAVGVLPFPEEDDADPWWRLIVSAEAAAPRIVARLPFGVRGNARREGANALVIARTMPEKTGHDRSFLVVEVVADLSRARLVALLKGVGFDCTFFAPFQRGGLCSNLIEVEGFLGPGDRRLASLVEALGPASDRIVPLGGYAVFDGAP